MEVHNLNFEEIATGLDLETFTERPQKHFDWKEEIQTLVGPLMNELKGVTARPRLIENLRAHVSYYEKQISLVKNALENINNLIAQAREESLKKHLEELKDHWNSKGIQISSQLTVAQYQLNDKLGERKSLLESGQNIVRVFF